MRTAGQFESAREESAFHIVELLKACATQKDLGRGFKLHAYIQDHKFLEKNVYIGSTLVDMYVKCGALAKAQQVLEELPVRNVVTWSAIIAGYAQQGQGEEALKCFDNMQREGHSPNAVTFTCALKACGIIRAAAKGEEIHDKIASLGKLQKDIILGNALVDMYIKCGALAKAQRVLEELPIRNVVTWSALIAGYVQQGQAEEALMCYDGMLHEGHTPNAVTFACFLKACGSIKAVAKVEEIHHKVVSLGMLEKDIVLINTLVDVYVKCSALAKAQQVLEELPVLDVVTWNVLIAGYGQQGHEEEALKCYDRMLREGHSPNAVTFLYALRACGSIGALAKGKEIHDKIASSGMLEEDILLMSAIVDMYAKCGVLAKAQQVLEELPVHDVDTWNVLIAGYAQQGHGEEALKCYDRMVSDGHFPNAVTFVCALKACGSIGAGAKGEEIHDNIVSLGMLEKDIVLGGAVVDMYAKCGALAKAQRVLEELPARDIVMWNALIAGYAQKEQWAEALKCFDNMLHERHSPDVITFICVLKACGSVGVVAKGEQIHTKLVSLAMLEKNIELGNSLVDMYAKCGAFMKALKVLKELPVWNVVTWSAIITGYALQGQSLEAINCFKIMQMKGVKPDSTTLTSMLNACSHSGLLDQAKAYFTGMSSRYGIEPDFNHCCCMVDIFGRAGRFNETLTMIGQMPSDEYLSTWVALLGACRKWGEVNVGRLAFDRALHLDKSNTAIYVLMVNIYTALGMHDEADKIDATRAENNANWLFSI